MPKGCIPSHQVRYVTDDDELVLRTYCRGQGQICLYIPGWTFHPLGEPTAVLQDVLMSSKQNLISRAACTSGCSHCALVAPSLICQSFCYMEPWGSATVGDAGGMRALIPPRCCASLHIPLSTVTST